MEEKPATREMADPPSGRGQRQAAGQQRELMKQLTSGGGGLSGGVSVQEVPSSPKTSGAPASHHKKAAPDAPSSASHHKRSSQAHDRHIVKKRKLQMHPPLDIKEYLELDAERGIAQRVGDGPERARTPHLLFFLDRNDLMRQPESTADAWTPDAIAHGMAFVYSKLPREERLDYERQSDAEMLRYKEQFTKARAEHEASERNTPRDAFDIYEANVGPRLRQQFPLLTPLELEVRLRGEWDNLGTEAKEGYLFIAERDVDRCSGYNLLWLADDRRPKGPEGPEPSGKSKEAPATRKFVHYPPQYCGACGNCLVGTLLATCDRCGKTIDETTVAFAAKGAWVPRRKVGADESQEVDIVTTD